MSEKRDQAYFADGIAEEVLDRLAKVPGLRVVGRASSFQFRGKNTDPASIGTALGVAYLLEGSLRREEGRVRVAAQLVEARTGAERWSDHFDSDLKDVLGVQDTLAAKLARALQITVEADTARRPGSSRRPPLMPICAVCSPKIASRGKTVMQPWLIFSGEDLYLIKGDPLLKNLEGDARYKAFLRKMNLPE
jgi:TolB-like protein